jgi:hypothetical protein
MRSAALVGVFLALAPPPATFAQRIQFPSAIADDDPYYAGQSSAALDGSIGAAPPGWDPYADPAAPAADPYSLAGPPGLSFPRTRLMQAIRLEHTWLSRFGAEGFGTNDTDINASFAVPFFVNPSPILITPGFTIHAWDGPDSSAFAGSPDLPGSAYDAYLDTSWEPRLTSWLSADLGVRIGVYSDFNRINTDSIRLLGRALGVVTFSPQWQLALGVVYLDRLNVKILPAGGVIWTPNADTRYEILFPDPKLSQRLVTLGNTDVWIYLAGEYGGGSWTIERASGAADRVDYNDLRVLLGLEARGLSGWTAHFEVGYVFDREILYISPTPDVTPDDTFMLRLGASY